MDPVRELPCLLCDDRKKKKVNVLRRHILEHFRYKPIVCDQCSVKLYDPSDKSQHMSTHMHFSFTTKCMDYMEFLVDMVESHCHVAILNGEEDLVQSLQAQIPALPSKSPPKSGQKVDKKKRAKQCSSSASDECAPVVKKKKKESSSDTDSSTTSDSVVPPKKLCRKCNVRVVDATVEKWHHVTSLHAPPGFKIECPVEGCDYAKASTVKYKKHIRKEHKDSKANLYVLKETTMFRKMSEECFGSRKKSNSAAGETLKTAAVKQIPSTSKQNVVENSNETTAPAKVKENANSRKCGGKATENRDEDSSVQCGSKSKSLTNPKDIPQYPQETAVKSSASIPQVPSANNANKDSSEERSTKTSSKSKKQAVSKESSTSEIKGAEKEVGTGAETSNEQRKEAISTTPKAPPKQCYVIKCDRCGCDVPNGVADKIEHIKTRHSFSLPKLADDHWNLADQNVVRELRICFNTKFQDDIASLCILCSKSLNSLGGRVGHSKGHVRDFCPHCTEFMGLSVKPNELCKHIVEIHGKECNAEEMIERFRDKHTQMFGRCFPAHKWSPKVPKSNKGSPAVASTSSNLALDGNLSLQEALAAEKDSCKKQKDVPSNVEQPQQEKTYEELVSSLGKKGGDRSQSTPDPPKPLPVSVLLPNPPMPPPISVEPARVNKSVTPPRSPSEVDDDIEIVEVITSANQTVLRCGLCKGIYENTFQDMARHVWISHSLFPRAPYACPIASCSTAEYTIDTIAKHLAHDHKDHKNRAATARFSDVDFKHFKELHDKCFKCKPQ